MTALVEMASVPPWRQAKLDKKRRGEENDPTSLSSGGATSSRQRDFLSKTQTSENSFFYSHSGQPSSTRDPNRNDSRPVGKPVKARPSDKDFEILANSDSTEWNIHVDRGEREVSSGRISLNNMVSQSKQGEVNANGPTCTSPSVLNGALVDEERIGSVHDNPFVKNFGLKHVIKPASYNADPVHSGNVFGETSVNSGSRLSSTEADMPEMEEDYRPGSGFVHKILDKFALLTAKEEALRPGLNHHLPKRYSSLENLVDNVNESRKTSPRSVGDEVFTTSPKSNLQYYNKAKSVENLLHKGTSERPSSESYDSRRRAGSEMRDHGRHRSASDLRRHQAADANLAREDIIIIETTPSPRPLDEDPLRHTSRRRRTSSSERQLEQDELPKPNTVSSYRRKFESQRIEQNEQKLRKKKDRAPSVPVTSTASSHLATNGSKHKPISDNLPEVARVHVNGDNSRDSSFDTQNDPSADSSLNDVNYSEKDYENPMYEEIRASLRHVKPGKEEEITYSWKRNSGIDIFEGRNTPSSASVSSSSVVNNGNANLSSQSTMAPVSNTAQSMDVSNAVSKPAATTTTSSSSSKFSTNDSSKVQLISYKSTSSDSQEFDKAKSNNAQPQKKFENSTQQKPTVSVRKSLISASETKSTVVTTSKTEKTEDKIKADTSDSKEIISSVSTVSSRTVSNHTSGGSTSTKGPAPKPPVVKAPETGVTSAPVAPSKVMVNVGPKAAGDSDASSYRSGSRNRFEAEKSDQNYVQAGKTWFYQAGKFKANPEGVKRPNNSKTQDPVPKKRTSPAPPVVTVLNLTGDATDSSRTPTSNIDDYINGSTQDIPVTDIDESNTQPRDSLRSSSTSSAHGNGIVPKLDLSGITDNKKSVPSSTRGSPAPRKTVQACNYQFEGSHVVIGKGLLQTKKKAQKMKLHFEDSLNSTYEYPSEELMLEEYLAEHPTEKELVLTLSDYIADTDESSDDIDDASPKDDQRGSLMSTPGVGNQSSGLSSYRSKNTIEYQFGMEFERQAEKEREQRRKEEAKQETPVEDGDLIPADDDDLTGFSATSTTSDILF